MHKNEHLRELEIKLNEVLDSSLVSVEEIEKLAAHYRITGLYRYSLYNSLLIYVQGGTVCQAFKGWKKLGRHVKAGEKARIKICVPFFADKDKEGNFFPSGREKLIYFGTGPVFDVSQTEGKPLEYGHNTEGSTDVEYDVLKGLLQGLTKRPIVERVTGTARGHINDKEIVVSDMSNNVDRVKTLIHEVAHDLFGHVGSDKGPDTKEVEAEASTSLVLSVLGVNYELSRAYIAGWSQCTRMNSIDRMKILKVAEKIIKAAKPAPAEIKTAEPKAPRMNKGECPHKEKALKTIERGIKKVKELKTETMAARVAAMTPEERDKRIAELEAKVSVKAA